MKATEAYALSRSYTAKTADALGAVKGAPCTIKSTEHKDGRNKIVFEWTGDSGAKQETTIYVYDGTPIYVWEGDGTTYKYGDLVIYASAFYRCIYENSDTTFDESHWQEIGSSDGNYDIVPDETFLPTRFTPADKKMFYAYEEDVFYFWNGYNWAKKFDLSKKQDKLTPKDGIIIKKNEDTEETEISIDCMTSEELSEMWKDAGVLELSTQAVNISVGASDTVTVTKHSGTVTVESADSAIATATINGNTITIQGVAAGSTTISVISGKISTNRKIEKAIEVTVS